MRGQAVGSNPIFDGMCAMCGTLLHGAIDNCTALSNKTAAPPINRDGSLVLNADGSVDTGAQPPFLLRFSPRMFAKEAPDMDLELCERRWDGQSYDEGRRPNFGDQILEAHD